MHAADVVVVQLVVEQSERATTAPTVALVVEKLKPARVTLATYVPRLYGDIAVIAGPAGIPYRVELRRDGMHAEKRRRGAK